MVFQVDTPVVTTEPRVVVDAGLPAGRHTFQLVVVDARGRRSAPARLTVTVTGSRRAPQPDRRAPR